MNHIDLVYYSLLGELVEDAAIPWVENAFAPGKPCALAYAEVYEACRRLCARLGQEDEDEDVELIINAFLGMQQELCEKMFLYGMLYGKITER